MCVLLGSLVAGAWGLYDRYDDVFDLTADNFDAMVLKSDYIWVVEFYAPW